MAFKRQNRRKIKTTVVALISILFFFVFIILLFLGYIFIAPVVKFGINSSQDKLIAPNGEITSIMQLSQELAKKNLILDSLSISSESGVIVGQIKEGPRVYFSQNREASWQVASLALIVLRTTVDNKKPVLIDLRSSRPIVKF